MALCFDQVAFSGGGIRCFWHGGFMSVLGDFQAIAPARVIGVSGGALSAAAWIGGVEDDLRELMGLAFDHCDANVARGMGNFTPHQELYRSVVENTLDEAALVRIGEGPSFQIALGLTPRWMPTFLGAILGGAAYKAEQLVRADPHLEWSRKLGLEIMRVDARLAAREGRLIDLICAAATIPPVFDIPLWEGRQVVDGALVDKAPRPEPDLGSTLVLLTRVYDSVPRGDRVRYAQPTHPVAADKIDFTDRSKIDDTWRHGRQDAKQWLAEH